MQANEDELQKALNDITNQTPSENTGAVPTTDASEAPAGIIPPADTVPAANPTPDASALVDSITGTTEVNQAPASADLGAAPELGTPNFGVMPGNEQTAADPATAFTAPVAPTEATSSVAPSAPEAMPEAMPAPEAAPAAVDTSNLDSVKSNILKDLAPLMDKIQAEPEKKFEIYSDMLEANNDTSVVGAAYETARQIGDESKRGEALLSLFEKIEQLEH